MKPGLTGAPTGIFFGVETRGGKGPVGWFYDQIKYLQTPTVESGAEADIKIAYTVTSIAGGHALISFDEV